MTSNKKSVHPNARKILPLDEGRIYKRTNTCWYQIDRIIGDRVIYKIITNTNVKQAPSDVHVNTFRESVMLIQYCEKCQTPAEVALVRQGRPTQLVCRAHSPIAFAINDTHAPPTRGQP